MSCEVTERKTGCVLASPYKVDDFKLRRLPLRSGATVTEDSHDFSWGEMTNPGRVLCLQALYFPILQHRGTHTHPMPILLYRGSTPQSLPVSFTALSDVSAISELPRHHGISDRGPTARILPLWEVIDEIDSAQFSDNRSEGASYSKHGDGP